MHGATSCRPSAFTDADLAGVTDDGASLRYAGDCPRLIGNGPAYFISAISQIIIPLLRDFSLLSRVASIRCPDCSHPTVQCT